MTILILGVLLSQTWTLWIAGALFGLHNYAALARPKTQRLKIVWHLIQFICVALFMQTGYANIVSENLGAFVFNIIVAGGCYNIVLHGLKRLKWKIPEWF